MTSTVAPVVRLALLDALTAGLGLGYLAHQYREVLVTHAATVGLILLVAAALLGVLRVAARVLRRANARVAAIFVDELDRPSPRPRR